MVRFIFRSEMRIPIKRALQLQIEVSTCDGLLYQVTPEDDITIPGPGVLPI